MRKIQAKRIACIMASTWLRGDLGQGAVGESYYTEELGLSDEDQRKVEDAMDDLIYELARRGDRWDPR